MKQYSNSDLQKLLDIITSAKAHREITGKETEEQRLAYKFWTTEIINAQAHNTVYKNDVSATKNEYDLLEERKDKAWGDLGNTLYEMSKDED